MTLWNDAYTENPGPGYFSQPDPQSNGGEKLGRPDTTTSQTAIRHIWRSVKSEVGW